VRGFLNGPLFSHLLSFSFWIFLHFILPWPLALLISPFYFGFLPPSLVFRALILLSSVFAFLSVLCFPILSLIRRSRSWSVWPCLFRYSRYAVFSFLFCFSFSLFLHFFFPPVLVLMMTAYPFFLHMETFLLLFLLVSLLSTFFLSPVFQ